MNVKINCLSDTEPARFASEELEKYLNIIYKGNLPETEYEISVNENLNDLADEFKISSASGRIKLEGANPRAALFAVYAFLEEYLQARWHHAGDETLPPSPPEDLEVKDKTYSGDFTDRGFNMETVYSSEDMTPLIDWMPKNRINNAAMPFHSWDKFKDEIAPEIKKRGLKLALSGHSYFRFLPHEKYFTEHPEWYALVNGERMKKGQFCFSNEKAQKVFCENVLSFLENEETPIARLSIWPADNKHCCECDSCAKKTFLENYMQLISKLKETLRNKGLEIEVDHLAYNASLEDAMLAPPESTETLSIDTQLAFWGRDYSQPLESSTTPSDINAKKHIENWAQIHNRGENGLYILEYYTDFWMLTSLYPPLTKVIPNDIDFYKKIGVKGIFSLGVACKYGSFKGTSFPWKWMQGLNLFLFARYCWNIESDLNALLEDYFSSYYGNRAEDAKKIFKILENSLAPLTAFNIPLFRLRFPDIWQRDETPEDGGIFFKPSDWHPKQSQNSYEKERVAICEKLLKAFEANSPENSNGNEHFEKLIEYYEYAKNKTRSLHLQVQAQEFIKTGKKDAAIENLKEALDLENKMFGENSEDCKKWLNKLQA